ncbi:MAG: hypothetical protein WD847_13315 [Pirellulales bacterium]
MNPHEDAVTLYRPVGRQELDLIRESGWRKFPPRLFWQPIFYPVLTEDYAMRIAREWNSRDPAVGNVGYVLRFSVRSEYIGQFVPQQVGGRELTEYWIPAEELEALNANIVGLIELRHEFRHGKQWNEPE